ncbi:MAG TPA: L,D-transpeptidase family protein [Gaiellaceae bacterium]|jgi:lipoprotein-anchoring transpeptidase ErfK/SrfK
MKRFVTLAVVAAAITAAAVATAAHPGKAATKDDPVVETTFPAAGELNEGSVTVRSKPASSAKKIAVMKYFRPDYRVQEIFAVSSVTSSSGKPWYHIMVPGRPNGRYGYIPASSVSLSPTIAQIVVNRSKRVIDVYRNNKHVWHGKVAVGAPGMETPLGHYYVQVAFKPVNDPFLGVWALETSAYSKLSDWPGGGVVGIHGTNEPWLLGKAVSHGCVRVSNTTARKLKRYVPVGTPITIKS